MPKSIYCQSSHRNQQSDPTTPRTTLMPTSYQNQYHINLITNLHSQKNLRDTWNTIAKNHGYYQPFLDFDWFQTWLKYFGKHVQPLIFLVQHFDKTVAIAPFMITETKFRNLFVTRKIELIGNHISPIRGIILNNSSVDQLTTIYKQILDFLKSQCTTWDILDTGPLPFEHASYKCLSHAIDNYPLHSLRKLCFYSRYLDNIDYSSATYLQKRSKKLLSNLKTRENQLAKLGKTKVTIEHHITNLTDILQIYQDVRRRSWKIELSYVDFFHDFIRLAAHKGWLRFSILTLNDLAIACQIRFICNRTAYLWSTVYDKDYSKYSPGTLLLKKTLEHFIDNDNICEIDYLYGDEDYKRQWAPLQRSRDRILLYNKTFRGLLAYSVDKCVSLSDDNEYLSKLGKYTSYFFFRRFFASFSD
jgi:hypothetical protein